MTKQIPLTQGKVALVDDDLFDYLNQWKWFAHKQQFRNNVTKWYALRNSPRPNRTMIYMHRVVFGTTDPDMEVDHIDGDGLNNQRDNLRETTHAQNIYNSRPNKNNRTGYKGVSFDKKKKKFSSCICVKRKRIHLGWFHDPVEAARAYDEAAIKYFGVYAWLNFPK